jgi:DNA-binding NarL/FixJ family response regulator
MKKLRLIMADDHTLVLAGFRKLLEAEFDIVHVAEDGRSLVHAAEQLKPDVILLDISMPMLNGIEAARQIRSRAPNSKLIFVTMHSNADYVREAMRAGASGYLLKRSAASELVPAIRAVFAGHQYLTPLIDRELVSSRNDKHETSSHALTDRQREVLQLIAEGRAVKEIASILHVSSKTVEYHKTCIARRLGIRATAALTRYAIDNKIVAN